MIRPGAVSDPPSLKEATDNVLIMAAGTGVSVMYGSGDWFDNFNVTGIIAPAYPADSPWATGVGGSDAHILEAIGKSATGVPGRTPGALRSAIERGRTEPVSSRYQDGALLRYLAWGLNHDRVATVFEQVPG